MNISEFIYHIVKYQNIDSVLNSYKSQSEKGFVYERLWDICIKFGFCDKFPNSRFTHLTGNTNNGKLKKNNNIF